ncbi:Hypothetical protein Cp262_1314 [Corynebacterium pseudotuberculosis]|nr:Hypothetical protein Cp262_1314 [Corynebacterium pseudotuberculosis]
MKLLKPLFFGLHFYMQLSGQKKTTRTLHLAVQLRLKTLCRIIQRPNGNSYA